MARNSKVSNKYRDQYIDLGLRIAYYRRRLAMTQEQLAEKADISRGYLGEIESPNTARTMSLEVLFSLAEALEMPVSKLLEEFRD